LIDGDPQGSLTISLGYREPDRLELTLASLLSEIMEEQKPSVSKTIIHHEFAVSTYNTDYILTKADNYDRALSVLEAAGYTVI